ncbi:hypothetical protein DOTSEDRAFT_72490 [Dothistroma septosporum NZE10]|uniref:Uncharacterized protein n=1 Tax=Dothistroma septosporum (strain NZE10 / CBS 128990) TaxID=675120 RepID=M2WM60_DOTSN|nr:hypothetical protein DOTSEDRAFT_72490 [Dothistroma septosporum NZE10]
MRYSNLTWVKHSRCALLAENGARHGRTRLEADDACRCAQNSDTKVSTVVCSICWTGTVVASVVASALRETAGSLAKVMRC